MKTRMKNSLVIDLDRRVHRSAVDSRPTTSRSGRTCSP